MLEGRAAEWEAQTSLARHHTLLALFPRLQTPVAAGLAQQARGAPRSIPSSFRATVSEWATAEHPSFP